MLPIDLHTCTIMVRILPSCVFLAGCILARSLHQPDACEPLDEVSMLQLHRSPRLLEEDTAMDDAVEEEAGPMAEPGEDVDLL